MSALDTLCAAALARASDRPAIEFEQRWISWGEMRQVADRLLQLIAPLQPATVKIAFVARNRPSALAAFLAMLSQCCAVRMLYPFQSHEAIARELENIKPDLFVAAEEDYSDALLTALEQQRISAVALQGMHARSVLDFAAGRKEGAAHKQRRDVPCEITILTSGTTGTPKEFALGYDMLARHIVGNVEPDSDAQLSVPPIVLMFPVSNISGLYSTLPPLLKGVRVVLLDRFTVAGWRDYVVRHRPQMTGLPPAGIQMLLDADIPQQDLASVRAIGTGAAPLPQKVHREFLQRYGIPILLSYGATEFGGPVVAMTLDLHVQWGDAKFGSVGRAMAGVQLRIVDPESGAVLPAGEEGILEVIAPRIGSQWIRTSDIALIDADGFMFMQRRADGAIMRGGFKLLPTSIEHALLLHPAISAASVVGLKDRRLGEVPVAAVELKPGDWKIDAAELEAHLRRHVPATHIPVLWRITQSLPRTPSMKVDQAAVRKLFAEDAARIA